LDRPHIIYILSDEHRGQAMSHMGDPNVRTPWMDRLANEGASFSRAYTNCPICTPARGTIFSGRHAHSGPVAGFFDVYKPTAPSTATELHKVGYHSVYFGKWHCGIVHDQIPESVKNDTTGQFEGGSRNRTPECHRAGFRDWYGFENLNRHFNSSIYENENRNPTPLEGYETDALTDMAMEYIRSYEKEEPLFMVLSVTPPHFPLIVPEEWKRFDPATLEVRENFEESPEMPDWRGLVDERWKYAFIENRIELLYDLETDPYELHNLAKENVEKCAELRGRLLELLEETRDPYWDVLIEHGVACDEEIIDANDSPRRRLAYLD